jgi:Flp pilus assembly pilin Flp
MKFWRFLWKREEGQTMAEYGIVLAVITLVVVAVLATLSSAIAGKLSEIVGILG